MENPDLNPRSGRILATVVREYIQTGEPVASMVIARRGALGVSSATVRNILVQLETGGFVRQPHTSAGRVPTDRGYRFYVDLLLEGRRPTRADAMVDRLRRETGETPLQDEVLAHVSHLLSAESHHVGFALSAPPADARLSKIEFVALASTKIMVVIVAEGGQVAQKVVDVGEPLSPDDLRRAAEYVNREFHGLPLVQVRDALLARLNEERSLYDTLMRHAWDLAARSLARAPQVLYVEGTATLVDFAEEAGVPLATLRALIGLMEEKQRLVRLLTEYLDGPGLTVVIGAEHSDPSLQSLSLVASTFDDGHGIGSVGVIGPTRMRYSKAIAVVDEAARAISRVLTPSN